MSNLPISSKYRSQPDKPVDETEREDLARRLGDAYAAGRVDQADYQQLLDRTFAARTLGELAPVVERLPVRATFDEPAMVRQEGTLPPGELAPAASSQTMGKLVMLGAGASGLVIVLLLVMVALGVF